MLLSSCLARRVLITEYSLRRQDKEAGENPAQPRYGKEDKAFSKPLGKTGKASAEDDPESGYFPAAMKETFHEGWKVFFCYLKADLVGSAFFFRFTCSSSR